MLNVVSVDYAAEFLKNNCKAVTDVEEVLLSDSIGRTIAIDIIGEEDIPSFSRSTMDGYAVKASDTFGASDSIPAMLEAAGEILMGDEAILPLEDCQCIRISTGGMLPENADSVVPVEVAQEENDGTVLIFKSVSPFENVTRKGDDVRCGTAVIKKGTVIKPTHIGVLAALGICKVSVSKKLTVGIISTGDELVEIEKKPLPGQIRDVNSFILDAMIKNFGCTPKLYGIVTDDYNALYSAVKTASEECDMVLVSGGSSAGARDMTAKIISELGEVFIHGLAMKPGKPTIIGQIRGKNVFGLPGHPAACFFVTEVLVKKHIKALLSSSVNESYSEFRISENIFSNNGREEYICVKIQDGVAIPLHAKSGIISLLSVADGYIKIDRDCEGLKKDEIVKVYHI